VVLHLAPHFRLLTLGAPLLVPASKEAVRYRTRKHFALLIRLALEPGRKFARDYLIDLLWPDVPSERGRHSLSQAITVLRQTLGRTAVAAHRTTVALNEGVVEVDALQLETCEAEIRGRFLEGFELRGARGFDEWREALAARLYPRIRDCLVQRMDAGRRIGDFASVERHALLLEELDPLSEDAVRGVMEARAWVGDRSNALKAFARFAGRLAEELNAKPSPELVRIVDLLREGRRATPRPTPDGVPPREERRFEAETIIGREREFSSLYDAWIDVRRREPRVIVVLGDPGIGKTTLTNAFVSSCQMEGAIIARTQAYDAERELPYAVLAELVRQLTLQRSIGAAEPEALAELSRLTPEIHSVFPGVPRPAEWPPEVVPLRLADSFFKAVTVSADDFPVVLVVDDIHAADNASVAILHMLARKLSGLRVLLILTGRHGSLRPPSSAHALVTDTVIDGLETLELEPLPNEAAALLVARACAKGIERWGPPPVEKIVRSGGGNPLAIELLSREWVESGGDSLAAQLDSLHTAPARLLSIPKAIRAMVERQTEQLDERTRAVLDLAAVLGRRMADLAMYHVIGCTDAEALYHLAQLLEVHLLRDIAGNLEFRNELIRAHVYVEIPSPVRFEMHRSVGRILEDRSDGPPSDLEIAWHHLLGRDTDRAIPFAVRGSERSLKAGAAREAELVLQRLAMDEADSINVAPIRLILCSALMNQSKAEEALPLLERTLSDPVASKPTIAQAARMYAQAMYLLNRDRGAKHPEMAERAVAVARDCGDKDLLARALFECARAGVESGNLAMLQSAHDELGEMVDTAGGCPSPITSYAKSYSTYHLLEVETALAFAKQAVVGLSKEGNIEEVALAYTALGNCHTALCQFNEARAAYREALVLSKRMGDDCRVSILNSNISVTYLMAGRVTEATTFGEESLRIGRLAPAQPALVNTLSNLGFAYVLEGRTGKASECLHALRSWMEDRRSWGVRAESAVAVAEIELAVGNRSEALSVLAQADREVRTKSFAFVAQGAFDRLGVLLAYHREGPDASLAFARAQELRFRGRHPFAHLEAISGLAWAERSAMGSYSKSTEADLRLFDTLPVAGKRAIMVAQGFLE
jgi:DNA-binding SARP family transcriptional activator/tetratricopeptide (TPR) repeat protein